MAERLSHMTHRVHIGVNGEHIVTEIPNTGIATDWLGAAMPDTTVPGILEAYVANSHSSVPNSPTREDVGFPLTEIQVVEANDWSDGVDITLKACVTREMEISGRSVLELLEQCREKELEVVIRRRDGQPMPYRSLPADEGRISKLTASVATLTKELENLRRKLNDTPQSPAAW